MYDHAEDLPRANYIIKMKRAYHPGEGRKAEAKNQRHVHPKIKLFKEFHIELFKVSEKYENIKSN